jgi:hypothetical protein
MKKVETKVNETEQPATQPKFFEVARSEELNLRSLRQITLSLYSQIQSLVKLEYEKNKPLQTAFDVASEYSYTLKVIDEFYQKSRSGIGDVKVRLIAESTGFTKQM